MPEITTSVIQETLSQSFKDGDAIIISHTIIGGNGLVKHAFSGIAAAAAHAESLDRDPAVTNIYVNLQRLRPGSIADKRQDVEAYAWFLVDIDRRNKPLTDAEFDRLADFLKSCKGGRAMNVEQLDGFFAALIAGPETVMPSEYFPEVFGGEMSETCKFASLAEANEILGLMMQHWNSIARTLNREVYLPLLLQDENGVAHGNDWAHGFIRGTLMRHDGWLELVNDEEHGGCLIPMMMLHHEHDEDPEMRPKPITLEKREKAIAYMAAGLLGAYQYFRSHRQVSSGAHRSEPRRTSTKVGRNEMCPCGSGKKYKKCCGGARVN
jgi:uncharacterized protein